MCEPPDTGTQAKSRPLDITDPEEFAAQYSRSYPRLILIAAGMIGDSVFAEDIVQEAAIIAFEKSAEFTSGSNFAAWIAEIVRRCALNYRRKRGIRNTTPADPHVLSELLNGQRPSPADVPFSTPSGAIHESQTEFDDDVMNALTQLGDEARCCLLLRTVLGMSYAEISELMGIRQGTAMSHVHRGKSRMRKMLSSYMATGRQICEE